MASDYDSGYLCTLEKLELPAEEPWVSPDRSPQKSKELWWILNPKDCFQFNEGIQSGDRALSGISPDP